MRSFTLHRLQQAATLGFRLRFKGTISTLFRSSRHYRVGTQREQQQVPASYKESFSAVIASRTSLLQEVPEELHRIAGVSFEGRQDLLEKLYQGQPLAFVKEPTNEHDPHAVMVQTLDSKVLGYIPRECNLHFLQPICFGHVHSVGQTDAGMYGCKVTVQPTIPPVEVLPIPTSLGPFIDLVSCLRGSQWEALKQEILQSSDSRCAVTGSCTIEFSEQYQFDERARVLRLCGFKNLSPIVRRLNYMLVSNCIDESQASQQVALLNDWSVHEASMYIQHKTIVQKGTEQMSWKLDLGYLKDRHIDIPEEVSPLRLI